MSHTKGPWHVTAYRYGVYHGSQEDYRSMIASVTPANSEEGMANAHLIAAAPDLLAACKLALDCIPHCNGPGRDMTAVETCILAIAKAEGKA